MITAESLFFAILGTTRAEITPSVLATEITAELLFDENLGFDDFRITKDVYPTVAKLLRRSSASGRTTVPRCVSVIWAMRNPSSPAGRRSEQTSVRVTRMVVRSAVAPQTKSAATPAPAAMPTRGNPVHRKK